MNDARAVIGFLVKKHRNCLHILLAQKRGGDAKCGRYLPYGGKVKSGETDAEAMLRELNEESGVTAEPADIEDVGTLIRKNYVRNRRSGKYFFLSKWQVKIFLIDGWKGDFKDTEEMVAPRWFRVRTRRDNDLPATRMLAGDREAILRIVEGNKVTITVSYDMETLDPVDDPAIAPIEISWMKRLPRTR